MEIRVCPVCRRSVDDDVERGWLRECDVGTYECALLTIAELRSFFGQLTVSVDEYRDSRIVVTDGVLHEKKYPRAFAMLTGE